MFNESNVTDVKSTTDISDQIERMEKIFRMALIIQASISTFANLAVFLVYIRLGKSREKFSNYLLFCTALSDLFVSGLSWYSYYASTMASSPTLDDVQIVQYGLIDYSFALCLGSLLLSSVDRWYSVSKPLRHREITHRENIRCVIVIVWVLSLLPPLIRLGLAKYCYENLYNSNDKIFNYWYRSILLVVILLIMVILIWTGVKVAKIFNRSSGKVIPLDEKPTTILDGNRKKNVLAHKRNKRVVKIFLGMIAAFGLTFLPITIGMFLFDAGALDDMQEIDLVAFTIFCDLFYFTSSLINPFLTLFFQKDFRRTLINIIMFRTGTSVARNTLHRYLSQRKINNSNVW